MIDREKLIENLVNRIVDDMDTKTLMVLATDYLTKSYGEYTDEQLQEEVTEQYPELLDM